MSVGRIPSNNLQISEEIEKISTGSPGSRLETVEQTIEQFAESLLGFHAQTGDARKAQLTAQLQQAPNGSQAAADNNPLGFLLRPNKDDAGAVKSFKAGGAYFNKQMAVENGAYKAVEQKIKLPTMTFDPNRFYVPRKGGTMLDRINNYLTSPLDKPSVYLGGSTTIKKGVGGEMDVGLTLDRVYNKNGEATFTTNPKSSDMRNPADCFTVKVENGFYVARSEDGSKTVKAPVTEVDAKLAETLKPNENHTNKEVVMDIGGLKLRPNFAFRPTERTINIKPGNKKTSNEWYNPPKDAAGLAKAKEQGKITDVNDSNVQNKYYYPGETVNMSLSVVGKNKANLSLEREGGTAADNYSHSFTQQGVGDNQKWQPKTVISIDQFTVDDHGLRVGSEFSGDKPKLHTLRKNEAGEVVGGYYDQGVQKTAARLENAEIISSTLIGKNGRKPIAGQSFYEVRSSELRNRNYDGIFKVGNADAETGAKTLNITPGRMSDDK